MISRRPLPGWVAIDQARALLIEVAAQDSEGRLARGLARFGSWRALAAIVGTDWLPLPRRRFATLRPLVRRRLRALGAEPAVPTTEELDDDAPLQLRGTCLRLPGEPGGDLWRTAVVEADGGLWAIEEGNDFVLRSAAGRATLVLADGGRLVNAEQLHEGDEVAVFGLPGQAPDRAGIGEGAYGRGGWIGTIGSDSTHPLLVSVIRRYDHQDDGPQD